MIHLSPSLMRAIYMQERENNMCIVKAERSGKDATGATISFIKVGGKFSLQDQLSYNT